MAQSELHFRLRIPPDLKRQVEAAAEANGRSMTAEIIARLATSFLVNVGENGTIDDAELLEVMSDIDRLKHKVIALRK